MAHQLFLMHCLEASCLPDSPSNFSRFWRGDRYGLSSLQGVQAFHTTGCSLGKRPELFAMCFLLEKLYLIPPPPSAKFSKSSPFPFLWDYC